MQYLEKFISLRAEAFRSWLELKIGSRYKISRRITKYATNIRNVNISAVSYIYAYFLAVVIIHIFVTTYNMHKENMEYISDMEFFLEKEGMRLNFDLYQRISMTEYVLNTVSDKIAQEAKSSIEDRLSAMLRYKRRNFRTDIFAWDVMFYVNQEGWKIADSLRGLYKKNENIYVGDSLSWIKTAKHLPFRIQFSGPIRSNNSGEDIIPAAIGISSSTGEFMGYLGINLSIKKLQQSLMNSIRHYTHFILIDDEFNLITSSDNDINQYSFNIPKNIVKDIRHRKNIDPKHLSFSLRINDILYTHYICSERYPFTFLLGKRNDSGAGSIILNGLSKLTLELIVLAIFVVMVHVTLIYPVRSIILNKSFNTSHIYCKEYRIIFAKLRKFKRIRSIYKRENQEISDLNNNLVHYNDMIKSNLSFLEHELKNPILSIIGFVDLLKNLPNGQMPDSAIDYINMIGAAASYQNKQIDFFSRLFHFKINNKQVECHPINLNKLIYTSINMVRHQIISNSITIEVDIQSNFPMIMGDEIMISQMMQNLISNGAKYNKKNGLLKIKAFTRFDNTERREVVIQFRDHGIGMEECDLQKIFDKFHRIINEETLNICGHGLGLTYAKHCALVHDGNMSVRSRKNIGTEFTVTFPKFRIYEET